MAEQQNPAFLLTREELFYALRATNHPNIPGLGVNPFEDIDRAILEKIMEVISRVLVARQLLILEDNKGFRLDKVLNAVLAVCAEPEKMVGLMFAHKQEPGRKIYFYSSSGFDVRQDVLFSDLYQFQIDADVDLGKEIVLGALDRQVQTSKEKFPQASYIVSNKEFEVAREKAVNSVEMSARALENLGLVGVHANNLATVFAQPSFRFTMQYLYRSENILNHKIISAISRDDSWWLVSAETPTSEALKVDNVSQNMVVEAIMEAYYSLGM